MDPNNQGNQVPIGAITYPARSNDEVQPVPVQPRQPHNLQGLLRFAMEATKVEDAPGNSQHAPMDDDRRRFLEEALRSLTVDLVEVLRRCIRTLSDPEKVSGGGQEPTDDATEAFDQIDDSIDDIDVANDFYKLGGFSIFPVCFGSACAAVRARAAAALAVLCQNNPFCQAKALESGLLNVLLHLIETETGNTLAKCLYALSCACREFAPSCRELIAQGGCSQLARLAGHADRHVRTKAVFLARYMAQQYTEAKEQLINSNIISLISNQLDNGHDDTSEHLLSTILTLTEGHDPRVMDQVTDPQINLKETLIRYLKSDELVDDSFVDEKEYARELIKLIDSWKRDDDYECDR